MPTALLCVLLLVAGCVPATAQDKTARIEALIQQYHHLRLFNGSALVAERGKVIFKKGYGSANLEWNIPNTPATKFRLGSITKQFTAALVLQLTAEGKIRLDGKLRDYLPDYPEETGRRVTIRQLLQHTSGIPSYTGLPEFWERVREPFTPDALIGVFARMPLEFEPDSQFRYNNSGYFLLGAILEKVTGQTYEQLLEERIFGPLEMKSSGYDHSETVLANRAAGYDKTLDGYRNTAYISMTAPSAAGALYSTVEDLYRWDQALYTDRPLPPALREQMFTPGKSDYGYGVFIYREEAYEGGPKITAVGHGGGINGFSTIIQRLIEDRHLVVLLNNTGGAPLMDMSRGIRNILYGKDAPAPKKPLAEALYPVWKEKGLDGVIEQYRAWKDTKPADLNVQPRGLGGLSGHLASIKRYEDAIRLLTLILEEDPKAIWVHGALGDAYRDSGEREKAIRSYAKALEQQPGDRRIASELGKLARQ